MSYSDIQLAKEAKDLRDEIGLDQFTPIQSIQELVEEEIGHELSEESFGDDFSAVCMTQDGIKFNIILNSDQMWNENFRRFTIAHELAHISLIQHQAEMMRNGGILKSKSEFQSNKVIEREADKFAINFLAPRPLVIEEIKNLEFDIHSLKILCSKLGLSLISGAFRFISLTDLCCSLIVIDNSTQKIKYEFRSKSMRDFNKHEYLSGWYIPNQGLVSRALIRPKEFDMPEEIVELSEYYQNFRKGLRCKETVFRMNYNDTSIALLSAIDDPTYQ